MISIYVYENMNTIPYTKFYEHVQSLFHNLQTNFWQLINFNLQYVKQINKEYKKTQKLPKLVYCKTYLQCCGFRKS